MTELSHKAQIDLTAQMFEAAADPRGKGWADVYASLSKLFSSGPGSLHVYSKREAVFRTLADTNAPGFIEEINRKYFEKIPYKSELLSLRPGGLLRRSQTISDANFEKTELYQESWKDHGIFYTAHYCLFDDRETSAGVTFTRPNSMSKFDDTEVKALAPTIQIMQRAVRLYADVTSLSEKDRLMLEGLDRVSQGVVIVCSKGKVQHVNTAAEKILAARRGMKVLRTGTLECELRADSEYLKALIKSSIEPASAVAHPSSGAMRVRLADGTHALSLRVTPLPMSAVNPFNSKRYAAVLMKPSSTVEDIRLLLTEVYSLTSTEATIASMLGSGLSLAEICGQLAVKENTARTHLKRIFAKTDTNRQSSLVSLIHSFPSSVDKI